MTHIPVKFKDKNKKMYFFLFNKKNLPTEYLYFSQIL